MNVQLTLLASIIFFNSFCISHTKKTGITAMKNHSIFQINFELLHKMEQKKAANLPKQQAYIFAAENLNIDENILEQINSNSLVISSIQDIPEMDSYLVIPLNGDFHSLDEINFSSLEYRNNFIALRLAYVKVENPDGIPYPAVPILIFPVSSSWLHDKSLEIEFTTFKKDLFTNEVTPDTAIIAPIILR